ncbi:MAG: selenium metabolism-associated LysR family transcriptional regulator, partial [Mobilitalea sp.]
MDIKQLEAFVKVVELQSFSKAANSLFLTQPTISAHIVSLEKEFNTKLLDRTTKMVHTTAAGEKLYKYAREIITLKEEILLELGGAQAVEKRIQIAASTIPSQHMLPELIPAFQKENKDVFFTIDTGDSQSVIDDILKHKIDIGFVGMKNRNNRLQFLPFYEDRLVIITPNTPYYAELLAQGCSLEKLMMEPMILRESGSGTKKAADRFLEAKKVEAKSLNIVARINDQEIIKRSVSKGMGISIMSNKSAIDYAKVGNLLIYEPEGEQITRYLY